MRGGGGGFAFVSEFLRRKQQSWNIIRQHSCHPKNNHQELKPQASSSIQRLGFSSQSNENETIQSDNKVSDKRRRRPTVKRSKFSDDSDSDSDLLDLSRDGLISLLRNKVKLLNEKNLEIETLKDKDLMILAENERVIQRTKRQTDDYKILAIQSFAKSLLDVADNLGRASSEAKDRFTKNETTEDPSGVLALLKTLLEGVEMTEKQLAEVFRKFGLERYDPVNEQFDPNRHNAVFQVPDQSRPPNTIAVVIKPGYALHERIIRPAEVGVVVADNMETE